MTRDDAFDCGVRCKNMDAETATRTFYDAGGIHSTTMTVPSGSQNSRTDLTDAYTYWSPESDPSDGEFASFWEGYYSEPRRVAPTHMEYPRPGDVPSDDYAESDAELDFFHNQMDKYHN